MAISLWGKTYDDPFVQVPEIFYGTVVLRA